MDIVDARGKACPQPVMMTRAAAGGTVSEIKVLVDNEVAVKNVCRFLEKIGFTTTRHGSGEDLVVEGHREISSSTLQDPGNTARPEGLQDVAVFISRPIIGGDDMELGEVLVKSFLGTLAQMDDPPRTIALMNEGIRLALKGTSSCEHLQELERRGVEIFVCGTCSNHFGLTGEVGVGIISNMFDITEALLDTSKILSI